MGQTIHHELFGSNNRPVHGLAHHVHHILSNGGTTNLLLCRIYENNTTTMNDPSDMIKLLCVVVRNLKLHKVGINPDLIGVHLLRAGGAMALKLRGASNTTIMKLGRWLSLTFVMYIHNQIGHLAKDLSTKMRTNLPFLNIAAIN
eukprot:13691565-Ditylum_brightwellii.AAC.1